MSSSTAPISSEKPTPRPAARFSPIPAKTFEGEWIPKMSLTLLMSVLPKPLTLSMIHSTTLLIPFHSPAIMLWPIVCRLFGSCLNMLMTFVMKLFIFSTMFEMFCFMLLKPFVKLFLRLLIQFVKVFLTLFTRFVMKFFMLSPHDLNLL